MANICCDDVYFYSQSNPEHLAALWEDLETSIVFCRNEDLAGIRNLFELKGIPTESLSLRGTVIAMERNPDNILLSTSAAWSPLYGAYQYQYRSFRPVFPRPLCSIHTRRNFPDTNRYSGE